MGSAGLVLDSRSAEDTERIGAALASALEEGDTVALTGDLGAGKTCLVRGLARGLGVDPSQPITSPTFTLVHVYSGEVEVYHFDLYRLSDMDELEAMGFRDFVGRVGVAVLEWADRVPEAVAPPAIRVELAGSGERRTLAVGWSGLGPARVAALSAALEPWRTVATGKDRR
jgi:tRNA threonylcarbamoyladenosine biosynthesis protein TsaE